MNVLITGASGFVGGALLARLDQQPNCNVSLAVRTMPEHVNNSNYIYHVRTIDETTDWSSALANVDVVVHCAARVHVMDDTATDPLAEFRRINVHGTMNLARQAATAGVKRLIFISSVKVNGEGTSGSHVYSESDIPNPIDPYGISKLEAEQALNALATEVGLEIVIIRPVLVYGPGVKANFKSMMNWLNKGVPLPLGAIRNKRSLVAIDNLVDLIVTCLDHPKAANQTFLVSDGEDLSTSELLRRMGHALGKPARLLPIPSWFLTLAAKSIGKSSISQRLCGSLQVDISKAKRVLGWTPPITVNEALKKTAVNFLESEKK